MTIICDECKREIAQAYVHDFGEYHFDCYLEKLKELKKRL